MKGEGRGEERGGVEVTLRWLSNRWPINKIFLSLSLFLTVCSHGPSSFKPNTHTVTHKHTHAHTHTNTQT